MDDVAYRVKVLARKLNLHNISQPGYKLDEAEDMSQLEYLEYILTEEQRMRSAKKHEKLLRQGHIPELTYDRTVQGINKEQLNRLMTLGFTETFSNLVIVGQCRTGKTSLASFLAELVIGENETAYYIKLNDLLDVLANKNASPAAKRKYEYMMTSTMVIIDEFLYTSINNAEQVLLFRFISAINDGTSLVLITNRFFDEWLDAAEDEFLMQTMIERLLGDCEVFKTQPLKNEFFPIRRPQKKARKNSATKI